MNQTVQRLVKELDPDYYLCTTMNCDGYITNLPRYPIYNDRRDGYKTIPCPQCGRNYVSVHPLSWVPDNMITKGESAKDFAERINRDNFRLKTKKSLSNKPKTITNQRKLINETNG